MEETSLALVKGSVAAIVSDPDHFAATFYDTLFEAEPDLRALFPTDLGRQKQRLLAELGFLIGAAERLDEFTDRARDLGARHVGYGAQPEHYEPVGNALVAAVSVATGELGGSDVLNAWTALVEHLSGAMIRGADELAP